MKRRRNAEQVILISSDSEPEKQASTNRDTEENGSNSDCDDYEEEDDTDVDNEDDEVDVDDDDDFDENEDDSDDDDEETQDTSDDDYDESEEDNDSDDDDGHTIPSVSKRVPDRDNRRRASRGVDVVRHVESHKEGKKKYKQKLKKGYRNVHSTTLSREDSKLLAEALNIISEGDLEELKSEHCKAYLRHHSLRLTGSKTTLLDRVREHVELKACGGMAKYPKSTFTINCTGDACTGDVVLFWQKVKNDKNASKHSTKLSWVTRVVAGRIVKESYGSDKQQHTFTVEVLWSRGRKALPLLYPLLIKGRKLYRLKTYRQQWANEDERKRVLEEKHSRGDMARNVRKDRVLGKRDKCSNRTWISEGQARVTSKRQQTSGSQSSVVRRQAWSNCEQKETRVTGAMVDQRVVSDHRGYERTVCETSRTTMSVLSIKGCFAGFLIGPQGRHIGSIERASGARLQICNHPLRPDLCLVEIVGLPDKVQVATGMVLKSFLDRGLPPPVVTATQPSGLIAVGWQAQGLGYSAPVLNYSPFMPHGAMRQHFR